jgi:aconitate hydratase
MTPRYLGCVAVIVKSFARIHETNLKKQGILALTFENAHDYDKIMEADRISIVGLQDLQPEKLVTCYLHHHHNHSEGGGTREKEKKDEDEKINLHHSYIESQLEWFRAGSALNILRSK